MKDYYRILGINQKAPLSEIKKSYRKLARKYHPDLNPGDENAEKNFKEITEAYEVLKDPKKRKQYDIFGSVKGDFRNNRGFSNFEGFDFTSPGGASFGDIFETIFGGAGGFQAQQKARKNRPQRGEDLNYSMNLSFLDAARGIETPIQIVRKETCAACKGKGIQSDSSKKTCSVCKGSGRIQKQTGFMKFASLCTHCGGTGILPGDPCTSCRGEGRIEKVGRIKVKIPPGVDNHSRVRISGKGNTGKFGGQGGDLIITIQVTPHPFFKRDGHHLEIELPVTYAEAALGAKIEVPTLDGHSVLKVPPSIQSGVKLRLKAKGILNPKTKSMGDMIIRIKIIPPSIKDLEVRDLLKKIEKIAPYNPREGLGK
ncbi:MAG: molecular chaperone DnaJ [Candidatus Aminicenantes bacterium]|nr:molecular chaperone DnaJ [Candidatus Aminicenantes bacterium]